MSAIGKASNAPELITELEVIQMKPAVSLFPKSKLIPSIPTKQNCTSACCRYAQVPTDVDNEEKTTEDQPAYQTEGECEAETKRLLAWEHYGLR